MDLDNIGTGLAVLGASQVTKDAVERMLAPTADYIGAGLLSTTKAGVNLARVLVLAVAKRGGRFEDGGKIPPRVLKGVLDEAPFCEDEITAEYLGGVLASSWSQRRRDDRAVAHLATIRRLSTYSLRMHYLLYEAYAALRFGEQLQLQDGLGVHIPEDHFLSLMAFTEDEQAGEAWAHAIVALEREDLADVPLAGSPQYFQRDYEGDGLPQKIADLLRADGGVVFRPTVAGTELFLAGCGFTGFDLDHVPRDAWDLGQLSIDSVALSVERCRMIDAGFRDPRRAR